ncbi:hypothetical protein VTK73DRAFT_5222 [Phialemonium thermophilum]|uniref:Cell wall proline rich protein n=1 Tax=Phialemonium thermophilum TaxID=223376 RepID=A0ABR3WPI9_9PEZI
MATRPGSGVMTDSRPSKDFDSTTQHLAFCSSPPAPSTEVSLSSIPPLGSESTAPLPVPRFVFPPQPSATSSSFLTNRDLRDAGNSRNYSLVSSDGVSRHVQKPAPLPDFSFPMASPGGAAAASHLLNPPLDLPASPMSPRSIPVRPGGAGHRRGGSEFVGGSIRDGDSMGVMSTSPTKSDSGALSPHFGPSKARRGHAHRRSAAMSSHDISSIIAPRSGSGSPVKGGSAPSSPGPGHWNPYLESNGNWTEPAQTFRSEGPQDELQTPTIPTMAIDKTPQAPLKATTRTRVGFSDTLEFIPRPLSMVSSDASSTATVRPGHSVSGSVSSVISLTSSVIVSKDDGCFGLRGPVPARTDPRPSTAGAVLERSQAVGETNGTSPSARRRNSIPHLSPVASVNAPIDPPSNSPARASKRWSFFSLDPFIGHNTPGQALGTHTAVDLTEQKFDSPVPVAAEEDTTDGFVSDSSEPKPVAKKRSKKHKKVKRWAGSILSRKSKARHVKHRRRTPTPPPRAFGPDDADDHEPSSSMVAGMTTPSVTVTTAPSEGEAEYKPSPYMPSEDDETSYPMIDLDAALGPFNTPLPRNAEWEAAQRAGGLAKKQLHSAAGMSRFTGPGMHYYHRRAESAPEMAPFDAGRFGIHRFGSNSTMADVFEEDEEDEDDCAVHKAIALSTPILETSAEESGHFTENTPESTQLRPDNGGPSPSQGGVPHGKAGNSVNELRSDDEKSLINSRVKSELTGTSLHQLIAEESSADTISQRDPKWGTAVKDSVDLQAQSPRWMSRGKDLTPVDVSPLHLPTPSLAPVSPYSLSQSSAFPSPRSPGSYDTQRISTAPSSIVEDSFQSLLMGEPGPEVRISVDDIPSLTSSNSTMTRESLLTQNPQARIPRLPDQPRPASFTSTAFGRRRSSLASLSRLISTSHGERSKLSIEVSLEPEVGKKPKTSKAKRLSRLVQFWKSKESNDE